MTARQRAQVVELLRCAADRSDGFDSVCCFGMTAGHVGCSAETAYLAGQALTQSVGYSGDDWQAACLEAAARVEEGGWPR